MGLTSVALAATDPLARPEWPPLALGTAAMFLGTLYFWTRGWGIEGERRRLFYAIVTLVTAASFAAYLAMLLGFGYVEAWFSGELRRVYWARYVDWLVTAPLLLWALALLARAGTGTVLSLAGAAVVMVLSGFAAAATPVLAYRAAWWVVAVVALSYVLYAVYFGLTERARALDADSRATFVVLRNLTLAAWALYPLWWLAGTEEVGLLPLFVEATGYAVLDGLSKVGFGLVLLLREG